ncbi:Rv2231c family pyridoxal phosphate-dependent protein CobC [Corynebacterium hansenii]|uniref:Rv2231c family pyridoxal phosphate-dependent protein CobC n=1 Tax=Corynebacterium hansenii TaxID=394964 RepID=A0ABV7ZMU7_9CORY|nr:Rv2231c family pyridoxal phosphate-dependent protein CobC [Corynebacterium hansenii]
MEMGDDAGTAFAETGFAGDLNYHGDVAACGALVDFAVNVRGATPRWLLDAVGGHLNELSAYPDPMLDRRVRRLIAARHGRTADEVLLLAGVAEGFALLPNLCERPAVIHPQFTEPEAAMRAAGVPVERVILRRPWDVAQVREEGRSGASAVRIPDDADLVVVGNPTNPTSVLHSREDILALRAPGRIVVVDEAFMDVVAAEDHDVSEVASVRDPGVLVFRSLTKTWALAGLRCGYALGAPEVLAKLARRRPSWPVGTLQLHAMRLVAEHGMDRPLELERESIARERAAMVASLDDAGWSVEPASGPFVLARPPVADPEAARLALANRGVAVRRCDTFPGLGTSWWRLAVRGATDVGTLVGEVARIAAIREGRGHPPK